MIKLCSFFLGFMLFASAFSGQDYVANNQNKNKDNNYNSVKEKLNQIETKYISLLDFDSRRDALKLVDDILALYQNNGPQNRYGNLITITNYVALTNYVTMTNIVNVAANNPAPVTPVDNPTFVKVLVSIARFENTSDKLISLRKAVDSYYFTVDQEQQILSLFQTEDEKMQALRLMYKKTSDRENSTRIYQSIQSSKNREEFNRMMNAK